MGQLWDYKIIQIKKFLNYIYQLDEKKILFYIFGISLVIRLLFIIIFPIKPHSDAANYNNLAIGLIEGTGYAGGIGSYLPPGQSFFLAAIYFIFGYNPQIACIIQALISSLTCIIIYYIGKSILNKKIGIISGLIAALYPTLIVFSGLLFSETLFIFLFSLLTLSLLRIYEERSAKNILIAGVSLGLATLVRPAIIGLLPFILIWMLLSSPDIKKNLIKFTVIILIAVVIISPWIIRNYNVHNEFVLVSTNGGVNFWIGNNPEATGTYGSCDWPNVPNSPFLETTDEIKRDRLGYEKGLDFIKENPYEFFILSFKKFSHFWRFPFTFSGLYLDGLFINPIPKWLFIVLVPLTIIPYVLLIPSTIFGIIFYQKWNNQAYLLVLLMFYYILIHSIVFGASRFHLQIIHCLIIFAAYGICSINRVLFEIKSNDSKRKTNMIIFFLSITVLIVVWYHCTYYWWGAICSAVENHFTALFWK
jgi:4-amino-4-deoxy-L-arabinose transferase-like glycosyltransferase